MRLLYSFLMFFLIVNLDFAQLWLVDPLEAIYDDRNQLESYHHKWNASFPSGADADVHVLVKISKGKTFSITASMNGQDLDTGVWNQLIDVPVEQNMGLDSRAEQYKGNINPYVVRRAPFRIFEVIQPLEENKIISETIYTALRLSISPSIIANKGTYKIKIKVKSDGFEKEGLFTIKMFPVKLPNPTESKFFYANWFNLQKMEEQHQLERWSDDWFNMLNKYTALMAHGRQNSITIPNELFKHEDGKITLEDEKLLLFINVFRKYDFKYFEAPHLMYRGDNDDWSDPELKVVLTKRRYYKEEGQIDIEILMNLIHDFVVKNSLTDVWLQHIADEPTSVNAKCYKDMVKQVREIYPEIKIMEATNDRNGIAGAIDVWCPLINDFQENESFFRNREKLGEKVLVYTCLIPGGKWLNRTLDMEKLRQVYFGW